MTYFLQSCYGFSKLLLICRINAFSRVLKRSRILVFLRTLPSNASAYIFVKPSDVQGRGDSETFFSCSFVPYRDFDVLAVSLRYFTRYWHGHATAFWLTGQAKFRFFVKELFIFLSFPDQNHILISFNFQPIHVIFLLRENSEIENGESKMMDLMTSGDIMANKKIRHHVEQAEGYILNAKQFRNVLSQRKPRGGVASSPPPLYVRGMSLLLRPRVNKARTD